MFVAFRLWNNLREWKRFLILGFGLTLLIPNGETGLPPRSVYNIEHTIQHSTAQEYKYQHQTRNKHGQRGSMVHYHSKIIKGQNWTKNMELITILWSANEQCAWLYNPCQYAILPQPVNSIHKYKYKYNRITTIKSVVLIKKPSCCRNNLNKHNKCLVLTMA